MTLGIDGAHYQYDNGPVHWDQIKAAGIDWVSWKCTQGSTFIDYSWDAAKAGINGQNFRHKFAYIWPEPYELMSKYRPVGTPQVQAQHYLDVAKLGDGWGAMIDAEASWWRNPKTGAISNNPGDANANGFSEYIGITEGDILAVCQAIERHTLRPVALYTGRYVASGGIWNSARIFDGTRPRILAAYTDEGRARSLALPHEWDAWQYTSNGRLPGITGPVDFDRIDNPDAFDPCCHATLPDSEGLLDTQRPPTQNGTPPTMTPTNPETGTWDQLVFICGGDEVKAATWGYAVVQAKLAQIRVHITADQIRGVQPNDPGPLLGAGNQLAIPRLHAQPDGSWAFVS